MTALTGQRTRGAKSETGREQVGRGLTRRQLLKLAAYSVPTATMINVTWSARVLAQSTPPGRWPRWVRLSPSNNPPPREEGAMGGAVLFGGAGSLLGDLWEWSTEGNWSPIEVSGGGPSPRSRHAATRGAWGDKLLVFGGHDGGNLLADTWILDFTIYPPEWRQVGTSPSPPARADSALVSLNYWDQSSGRYRREALLFGGEGAGGFLGDTWVFDFDSETWTQADVSGPAARAGHSLGIKAWVWDAAYLFGGEGAGGFLGDTWRFDGPTRTWTNLDLTGPSARRNHAVSTGWTPPEAGWYEAMYLFGGEDASGVLGDTWALVRIWDVDQEVEQWQKLELSPAPSPRAGHVMSSEPVWWGEDWSGGPLLFGGRDAAGNKLGDTWVLDLGPAPS